MTIVVTGGGSGGHITPILAVASELKRLNPGIRIVYIGQKGESLLDVLSKNPNIDEIRTVRAGKLRRYHGEGWKQLLALPTQAKNLRDALYVLIGVWQSYRLLKQLKPAVIFTRGGFVSVPVAYGAVLNHIPFVTHDSDSVPSLANRLIAKKARLHTTALPPEMYPYPSSKTVMVGIPLQAEYQPVTPKLQAAYKKRLGLAPDAPVILVTGGGNGARQLNEVVINNAEALLTSSPQLHILHIAGKSLAQEVSAAYDNLLPGTERGRVQVFGFASEFYRYSGAADVIIGRAGATNLAEFAVQAKACVIIPAAQLVGGHQIKNAEALARHQAIVMLTQDQAEQENRLAHVVSELLADDQKRLLLGQHLAQFARPDAAARLAVLLLEQAEANKYAIKT